jgi:hypothetical protein
MANLLGLLGISICVFVFWGCSDSAEPKETPECVQNIDCADFGANWVCDTDIGKCECLPNCQDKCCGDDGCGNDCADNCVEGQACNATSCTCEEVCVPQSCQELGKQCDFWDDGCGVDIDCGSCPSDHTCDADGICQEIPPSGVDGLLLSQGIAGLEQLVFWHQGQAQLLAEGGDFSFCADKIFCDGPPSPSASRFIYYDFLPPKHAVYLECAHTAKADTWIYSVDLENEEKTLLSGEVLWPAGNWDQWDRPSSVHSYGRVADVSYWLLETQNGMELFSNQAGDQILQSLNIFSLSEGHYAREGELKITAKGMGIRVLSSPEPLVYSARCWVADLDGQILYETNDQENSCDRIQVHNNMVLMAEYNSSSILNVILFDLSSKQVINTVEISSGYGFYPLNTNLSPKGDRFYVQDGESIKIYDVSSSLELADLEGYYAMFSPVDSDLVVVQNGYLLVLHDLVVGTEVVLSDGTAIDSGLFGYNDFPGQVFSPDGAWLVTVTGSPILMNWENIGLTLFSMTDLSSYEIIPPMTSEAYFRHIRFSSDGNWVVFLNESLDDGSLDVSALELETQNSYYVAETVPYERGFVIGSLFEFSMP